jgi:hypothetical protein
MRHLKRVNALVRCNHREFLVAFVQQVVHSSSFKVKVFSLNILGFEVKETPALEVNYETILLTLFHVKRKENLYRSAGIQCG